MRSERKALTGRYNQFLSGHAAIRSCHCEKIHKAEANDSLGAVWVPGSRARVSQRRSEGVRAEAPKVPFGQEHVWGPVLKCILSFLFFPFFKFFCYRHFLCLSYVLSFGLLLS